MDARYNRISLAWGVPGVIGQLGGRIALETTHNPLIALFSMLALLGGSVLLIIGLAYYAKAKGRHSAWALMGLLSLIGVLVLALLRDRSGDLELRKYPDCER